MADRDTRHYDKIVAERIPNKTQWALRDIQFISRDIQLDLTPIIEDSSDPATLRVLGLLANKVAQIESLAFNALRGHYGKPL